MCRGDRREKIFHSDTDRALFVRTLGEACGKTGWQVHAYVLMPNHYHMLIETPEPNLVAGMRWFQGTYTTRFNRRNKLSGHLFQGRYKAMLVDHASHNYLCTVSTYIHLNPVRARLIRATQLTGYSWCSVPEYLAKPKRPEWLRVDRVFGALGLDDTSAGRRRYREYLEDRGRKEKIGDAAIEQEYQRVRRGWCLGDDKFRDHSLSILAVATRKSSHAHSHSGAAVEAHNEAKAEQLIRETLTKLKTTIEEVQSLPWTEPRKRKLARLIRKKTTMTNSWVGARLGGGHESTVSRAVHEQG